MQKQETKVIEMKPILNNFDYAKNKIRTILEKYQMENKYEITNHGEYQVDIYDMPINQLAKLIKDINDADGLRFKILTDYRKESFSKLVIAFENIKINQLIELLDEKHGSELGDSIGLKIYHNDDEILYYDCLHLEGVDIDLIYDTLNNVINIEFTEDFYGNDGSYDDYVYKDGYIITFK